MVTDCEIPGIPRCTASWRAGIGVVCEDEGWSLENGEGIAVDFLTVIFSAVVIFFIYHFLERS